MTNWKVGYLIGSLASKSINRRLAVALVRLAPKELVMTEIPIADLPLYSSRPDVLLSSRRSLTRTPRTAAARRASSSNVPDMSFCQM